MKKALGVSMFALIGVNAITSTCPKTADPLLKKCCGEATSCTYKICHSMAKKSLDTKYCNEDYCTKHPSDVQCWDPTDAEKQCEFGASSNCTSKICF